MTDELTSEQLTHISNALYAGNKIEAIKFYRTATGRDLKDSKDAVEKLAAELEAKKSRHVRETTKTAWFVGGGGFLGRNSRSDCLLCGQMNQRVRSRPWLEKSGNPCRETGCRAR